jgi:hypothetical protein|tara:strand:+ start:1274 stop:1543 length:270 start_codon:yes stop_codon:yes gene_type:complete
MSDSVTKWHEMQEDKKTQSATGAGTFIYESPDGGKTVTKRPFGGDIKDRVVIQHPQKETYQLKQQAYRLLCDVDEEVIRMAIKIIDIGE